MRYDPETGKPSLPCDPETGKPAKHENLLKQISSASTGSSGSDKLCLEDSIPMGVYTGEKKIQTPSFRNLREENDKLRNQLQDQKEEIRVLTELVESGLETNSDRRSISSGDFPSGLDSVENRSIGGAKIVTNRSSMRTDEKGNPVASSTVGK